MKILIKVWKGKWTCTWL